jgi:hypothetical protein
VNEGQNEPRGPKGDRGEQGARGPGMSRKVLLGFVYLSVLMLLLAAANLLYTARQTSASDARARAQCRSNADLAGAPITVNPKTGKAALLLVKVVSDARVAWHQAGCPGPLPSPDPSFRRWAAYYHLPVS